MPAKGPRIDYPGAKWGARFFGELTLHILERLEAIPEEYARLLRKLEDCQPMGREDETVGTTYKQLAYIGHRAGFSADDRQRWIALAASIPLTQRHAGHIIARLNEEDREIAELKALLYASPGGD